MVSRAVPALTKIGFRRDVKIFLTALGCFFAVLIAILVLLLQNSVSEANDATLQQWNAVADVATRDVAQAVASGREANVGVLLTVLNGRYPVSGSEAVLASGMRFQTRSFATADTVIERSGPWGKLRLAFDSAPLVTLHRRAKVTTAIAAIATIGGLALLLLYIQRIVRPIEQLLDQASLIEERHPAVDEQSFLLDTFRKSVATLKEQKEELRVLHDQQKSRADELERVTAALTRGMTSGLLAIDPGGRVVDINQAGRDILRIESPSHEVAGSPSSRPGDPATQKPSDLQSVLGDTAFARLLRDAVNEHAPLARRETTITTATGETVVIGVTTIPLLDDAGAFLGLLALFTDLTPIRALESRLRDSQILADLGEMSAGIAHEFRNSLSTILGYLKLAQRHDEAEEILAKLRKAEEEAAQLSAAVESLLAFAKPIAIQRQPVELRELVEQVVARLEPAAPHVTFNVRGDVAVDGDPALLARAIQNVVRNAIDAIDADRNGRVDIELDPVRNAVVVRDNGSGFDPADASRLLLPFHSDKPGGFGLGLPLAKKIAVLHGGTVTMTGARGEGATVVIELGAPTGIAATVLH